MNSNKNKGFSFAEVALLLLIVIVIAATALPKLNTSFKSGAISVASTAGEFDNAVRLARAQWFSNGQSGVGRIDGFADGQVWSGPRGWPISHKAYQTPSGINPTHCANVWNGIMLRENAPRASTDDAEVWRAGSDGETGLCQYTSNTRNRHNVITYNTKSGKVNYRVGNHTVLSAGQKPPQGFRAQFSSP